jgi:hypothetical protein
MKAGGIYEERRMSGISSSPNAEFYKPRSSLIKTTLMRPLGNDFSVIVQTLQMRSGLLQSSQKEVLLQGVFLSSRMVLTGAA